MPQKEITKTVDITPHRSLMIKVGQTGYSLQEALSELIDNAIDARGDKKPLQVEINITPESIVVKDDGVGMSEEVAVKSIRLGFSNKTGQLGEFGLGLKTASTFMGKRFSIISSSNGDNQEYVIVFDEDEWLDNGSWTEYPVTIRDGVAPDQSGTAILIEKLKVTISPATVTKLYQELGLRFAPFINNGELQLIINNERCAPIEPVIVGEKHTFSLEGIGWHISGWWGYQLRGLNKSYFGFNTFRRGRLVTTYDKIGLNPNQDVKQIIGDVHIEGIKIAHDKKSWQKGTPQYKEIEEALRNYFASYDPRPKKLLSGYPASAGVVEGHVRILNMFLGSDIEAEIGRLKKGDIIVTEMTRPQFLLAIRRAGGIITDMGGNLSHAAIVAREFDIPAVVGTQNATKTLHEGQRVIIDANNGIVYEA